MTTEEKLKALQKMWGYAEVSQARISVSGWRVWLVKNYRGKPISEMYGEGLPGNPKATRRIEFSGSNRNATIGRAYNSTRHKLERQGKKKATSRGWLASTGTPALIVATMWEIHPVVNIFLN